MFGILKYEGIKKYYPRLPLHEKLKAYIVLCRPFTLVSPLLAGLIGTLIPVQEISFTHIKIAIYVGVTLALAQACGQIVNQYVDSDLDKIVKPYRPIPSGKVDRDEAIGIAWLLAIFSVARSYTISIVFGLVVSILIFFAVYYSLSPFSPRRINPFLNVGWIAFSRGFIPFVAVWSIYGNIFDSLRYALLAFVWVFAYQGTKDIPDVEGDKKYGIKTIPGEYGLNRFLDYMIVVTLIFYGLVSIFKVYTLIALLPLSLAICFYMDKQIQGMENNISWICFYLGLGLIYVLAFVGEHYV